MLPAHSMISIDLGLPADKPKIMIAIFLKTIPFFAIIGLGYFAVRRGMFTAEATAYLTKFVFYFALSAMLFRFSSSLSLGALLQWNFIFAYLLELELETEKR